MSWIDSKTLRRSTYKRTVRSLPLEQTESFSFGLSFMLQTLKLTQCFVCFLVTYIMQPVLASRAVKQDFNLLR